MAFNDGAQFSTKDRDNDGSDISCAYFQHGGWWFNACSSVNFNGRWASRESWKGMRWSSVTGNAASGRFELRFDFTYQGYDYYATYDTFVLSGESENYKFWTSGFDGNVWNVMAFNNGASFSTKDRDNDGSDISCAYYQHGGWWFDACSRVNLNGRWASKEDWKGMRWSSVTGNAASVSFSEMKIRPLDK
ncbi:ryncolin-4 [Aplysia californica]|uniref:Ryncolin-4 n=1 Tax=Aplysia californica TaxID=6500 RepID=A0ABM1VSU1_APLCA|nr:ryncolin-4 [Aplysia californica]